MKDQIEQYIRAGWKLVPIPTRTKGPINQGWNRDGNWLKSSDDLKDGYGVGLLHAYSGTCALDIDNTVEATRLLKQYNIDLAQLLDADDAIKIWSGTEFKSKLLYKLPEGMTLPSKKFSSNGETAYELRNSTIGELSVQDILPPSIHPNGKPYVWQSKNSDVTDLPDIPSALLTHWQNELSTKVSTENNNKYTGVTRAHIEKCLNQCDPNCSRDEWIKVGMAIHSWDEAEGFEMWNSWSASCKERYPGEKEVLKQWKSFRNDKQSSVTVGTLIAIAKLSHSDLYDVSINFSPIPNPMSEESENVIFVEEFGEPIIPGETVPPDFDLSFVPELLSTRASEISSAIGCDPLVPVFAGLSAVCAVVDSRSKLELLPGFVVPPVLWLMTIGAPADKKSPGSRPMLSPLRDIEELDKPRFAKEYQQWEGYEAAHASSKKAFLDYMSSTEALLSPENAPDVLELPVKPCPLKLTISDITSQMMVRAAAARPQGILCYLDEMNSWVKKMTDRNSGEDRSAWVVAYESEPYKMERVGAGEIYCDNMAISIYGNIQPTVFRQAVSSLAADGMLQRFIPAILRPEMTRLGEPIPEFMTSSTKWESLLKTLNNLPTMLYKLNESAYKTYRDFQEWYEIRKRDERLIGSSDEYMTAFGKIEGLVGRIALLFHLIDDPLNNFVNKNTLMRAITFVKGYVIPALKYAFNELAFSSTIEKEVGIVLRSHPKDTISFTELQTGLNKHSIYKMEKQFAYAMLMYENLKWVVRLGDGLWRINTKLKEMFQRHNDDVKNAKERIELDISRKKL